MVPRFGLLQLLQGLADKSVRLRGLAYRRRPTLYGSCFF